MLPMDPSLVVLDKLETIIQFLGILIGLPPNQQIIERFPDLGPLYQAGKTSVGQAAKTNEALELLLSAALPSAPANVTTITVGISEILLANNESAPLMRVDVTNLNVAQPLTISKRGVGLNSGQLVLARQTVPYVLPMGAQLYGVVALGTIVVAVSVGHQMQPIVAHIVEDAGG